MRTWIKFCATTSLDDALASIEAGADALGFVFAPSKRRVTADQVQVITSKLPNDIQRIGVFHNEDLDRVLLTAEQAGLTAVQLHGEESPAYMRTLREGWKGPSRLEIIKTVLMDDRFEFRFRALADGPPDCFDHILFDSGAGSGKTFRWSDLSEYFLRSCGDGMSGFKGPVIVAGGLKPENVGEMMNVLRPWGVDVVSGLEREPGRKDHEKLKAFVAAVRKAEQ
jgi:phosphoribosylanthranilate isomerase